jgi:hypothetical protein
MIGSLRTVTHGLKPQPRADPQPLTGDRFGRIIIANASLDCRR